MHPSSLCSSLFTVVCLVCAHGIGGSVAPTPTPSDGSSSTFSQTPSPSFASTLFPTYIYTSGPTFSPTISTTSAPSGPSSCDSCEVEVYGSAYDGKFTMTKTTSFEATSGDVRDGAIVLYEREILKGDDTRAILLLFDSDLVSPYSLNRRLESDLAFFAAQTASVIGRRPGCSKTVYWVLAGFSKSDPTYTTYDIEFPVYYTDDCSRDPSSIIAEWVKFDCSDCDQAPAASVGVYCGTTLPVPIVESCNATMVHVNGTNYDGIYNYTTNSYVLGATTMYRRTEDSAGGGFVLMFLYDELIAAAGRRLQASQHASPLFRMPEYSESTLSFFAANTNTTSLDLPSPTGPAGDGECPAVCRTNLYWVISSLIPESPTSKLYTQEYPWYQVHDCTASPADIAAQWEAKGDVRVETPSINVTVVACANV